MNNSMKPIGLFDSGIGGTSIWKEIHSLLPDENTIYLADSKNAPYGQKSKDEIIDLSIKNTEYLLNQNCKLIVIACNTATTNAIKELREKYDVPFIGIEPAIKPAALQTRTRTIGILATKGTLNSVLFHKTVAAFKNLTVIEQVGHGLVQLIEEGKIGGNEIDELLQLYLNPMLKADIDCLVLGCSHYPYLVPQIKKILPKSVKIIDSGLAVAKQTKTVLEKYELLNTGIQKSNQVFYTNANPEVLTTIVSKEYIVLKKDF
ncbi:glutamate racemase [Flavobacterium arcticum]|uniref:Glutamate racemase n=1 Tax=Flavobacterium arcticum TaxID=1784713 RepID=A0A345HC49_9FLAO|nr:glutamate racemase [Flavobacterium arcticum]AXG74159.1 glutamate racemase [Flavobacterium arcticum]KAF2508253.1 glutamate racemase [Flavobacterium arcticum]